MKRKILFTELLLVISFFAFSQNNNLKVESSTVQLSTGKAICPRTILLENFSSSIAPPCIMSDRRLYEILDEYEGSCAFIEYQMSWPENGDPYYTVEVRMRYI